MVSPLVLFGLLAQFGCQSLGTRSGVISDSGVAPAIPALPLASPHSSNAASPPVPITATTDLGAASLTTATEPALPPATSTLASTLSADPVAIRQIGVSIQGRSIISHRIGTGPVEVVLVGGMHGGYEWNTAALAYDLLDYYRLHWDEVPAPVTLYIIPGANPDGLYYVTGKEGDFESTSVISDTVPGRFNANNVDLNRNWDCRWSDTAIWGDQPVSPGTHPFSEPESESLRDFFLEVEPAVVVFLHSAADGVYPSGCPEPDEASYALATVYGLAASYPIYSSFEHYAITGDAGDWLTTWGIPSFTVELKTHESLDWEQNLAGVKSLLTFFADVDDQDHSQ